MESLISFIMSRRFLLIVITLVLSCCFIGTLGYMIYNPPAILIGLLGVTLEPSPTLSPSPTDNSSDSSGLPAPPQQTETQQALETSIAATVFAAQTETAAAAVPIIPEPGEETGEEGQQQQPDTNTSTEADKAACTIEVKQNLFCRPSPGYAQVDSFTAGTKIEGENVVGISPDSLFAFVKGPNQRVCTIPIGGRYADLSSGCDLPILTLMPPPTATPTPTFTPTFTPTLTPSPTNSPTNTPTVSPTP